MLKSISKERLRLILLEEGRTTRSTKGWKHSPDPEYSTKAARLRRPTRRPGVGRLGGVLVYFDEHAPVTPTQGRPGRWKRGRPGRIRANYRKPNGVAHLFGVYDVGADQLFGCWYFHKGADHVIATLKMISRSCEKCRQDSDRTVRRSGRTY